MGKAVAHSTKGTESVAAEVAISECFGECLGGLEDALDDALGRVPKPPVGAKRRFIVSKPRGNRDLGVEGEDCLGFFRTHSGTVSRKIV